MPEARSGFDRLFRPRTIAVIGGGTWCANVVEQCRKIGFAGDIWPVHPVRKDIGGAAAVASVAELPDAPDAAFVGINRDQTIDVVRALSERGSGGAVCFASGFREALGETSDGADKQDALLEAAGDMTILGPNCYGFLNLLDGAALWPDQHGGVRVERGVAIVTQSSNIAINLTMQDRGLPLAYVVTVGNQAQTGLSGVCRALLEDDRVTALGLYIEGIDDLGTFEAMALDARARDKPIVALKIGKSDQAQSATVSHTASLTGSDTGADALLNRLGIGRAGSLSVLLETLKLLHVVGTLPSNRIASMSCSGGEACLMADVAVGHGVVFPPLNDTQVSALGQVLGPKVALANPLDYHTYIWGDEDALAATFAAMMQGDLAMGCVVLDFPRSDRCDPSAWYPVISAVARAKALSNRPIAILSSLKETLPEDVSRRLMEMDIVPFAGMDDALAAMSIAAVMGQERANSTRLVLPPAPAPGQLLTEAEAKEALSSAGASVPVFETADTPTLAADAAERLGFPVVLKGQGLAHKSEAGAVSVGLSGWEDVRAAAEAMPTRTFLVEEMIADGVAELLIGVVADPAHGYVLTLAAGGTLAEVIEDSVSLLVPSEREEVRSALSGLRVSRLLKGYRGQEAANIDLILDAVAAVQHYVAVARPSEVEINPLICGPDRAVAADALIRIGD